MPVAEAARSDYDTYGSGTGNYNYMQRRSFSDVGANMAAFATTGEIQRPLITVAGTMDALLPIDHHARAYARKVEAARDGHGNGDGHGERKTAARTGSTKCRTATTSRRTRTRSRSSS